MKNYTSLNQLILEAEEDVKFKLEGRPEDNLLNGLVPKRFAYSYTYPKNSTSIITPKSILDYIINSTEGDANQIKTTINSLSSPAAVGISADPSNKAGLFGGKNRVEGHVYIFKNVTDDSVKSVNPEQLLGKTGSNNITALHVLSTPRTSGESIQQNLAKIINSSGKASANSTTSLTTASAKSTSKLTMMELNTIMPKAGPGGKPNGGMVYFTKVVNGTFRNPASPDVLLKDNEIIKIGDTSPVMLVLSKFFSSQSPLNSLVKGQVDSYTPDIKSAFTEILNKSGDPDYKVDASYDLDKLTKTQLVSIMSVWLIYAVNNGLIPRSEVETDTYPTLKTFIDSVTVAASAAPAGGQPASGQPAAGQGSAMDQATLAAKKKKQTERLAGPASIENEQELIEILKGTGYTDADIFVNNKLHPTFSSGLVTAAGDSFKNASAWKATDSTGNIILEFDTSNIGAFNADGTAKIFTPNFTGIHSALGILRLILLDKQTKSPISGQPTLNRVPTAADLLAMSKRKTGSITGPIQADIDLVKKGFGWDNDLAQAITFYRTEYYKKA